MNDIQEILRHRQARLGIGTSFNERIDRVIRNLNWWYIKFTVNSQTSLSLFNANIAISIKEVVSKPTGSSVTTYSTSSGGYISVDAPGTYELYYTIDGSTKCSGYFPEQVTIVRFPYPYYVNPENGLAHDGFIRYLHSVSATSQTSIFIPSSVPPIGRSDKAPETVLPASIAAKKNLTIYIPNGSLQNYISASSNSNYAAWLSMYNDGRLKEVHYAIYEQEKTDIDLLDI